MPPPSMPPSGPPQPMPPSSIPPAQPRRFGPLLLLAGGGCVCLVLLCVVGVVAFGASILSAVNAASSTVAALSTPFAPDTRTTVGPPPVIGGATIRPNPTIAPPPVSGGGTPRPNPTNAPPPIAGSTVRPVPTVAPTVDLSLSLGVEVMVPSMGAPHVPAGQPHPQYNSLPPTSGPHYDTAAPWGDPHTSLPEERWVHNLEHSGVVALYNCPQACPALVQSLDNFLKTGPPSSYGYVKLLVLPYTKIPNKLTLVAWEYYLPLADYDEDAILQFFEDHQDNGPEDVP